MYLFLYIIKYICFIKLFKRLLLAYLINDYTSILLLIIF